MSSTTATFGHPECQFCKMHHTGRCPHVRAIEYYPNGCVKRVEFVGPDGAAPEFVPTVPYLPSSGWLGVVPSGLDSPFTVVGGSTTIDTSSTGGFTFVNSTNSFTQ